MLTYAELLENQSKMNTWERWLVHEEIINILEEKGYETLNIKIRECKYGAYESIECDWRIAPILQKNLTALGYNTILERDTFKKSLSSIIFPYNLIEELLKNINELEENRP